MVDVFNTIKYFIGHIGGFCFHLLLSSGRVFVRISSTVSADKKKTTHIIYRPKTGADQVILTFSRGLGVPNYVSGVKSPEDFGWTFDERLAIE